MGRFLDTLTRLTGWRALVAAFALGLSAALALPPLHAVPVLLLAIPGLLALLGAAADWRRAAWLGLAWGWGHHLAGVYWVTHAILTDTAQFWWLVPLAAPGLALPLALFTLPPALLAWALPPGWPRLLGFAGAWVLAELGRGLLFSGFPWNLLGSVWAFAALPVQAAAWVGAPGLSLLTVLLAALPVLRRARPLFGGALALLALAGLGAWRLAVVVAPATPVQLVLVQGNVAQEVKWREDQRLPIFQRYVALGTEAARLAAAANPGAQVVVVWPETASPFLLAQDAEARRQATAALPGDATLLAGTVRIEWGPDGRPRRIFNSLVALDEAGDIRASYDKAHLVPFGEYMPLAGLLPIRLVVGGMDFSAGPGPQTLAVPGLPGFSPLICYEVIFPAAVAGTPRPGWLVNVTNDAWFGLSAGPWQHLAAARLRAVEEGLPLARAAQTGISAVFDAQGRLLARTGLGEVGTLTATLPGPLPATAFARLGLLPPAGLAGLCLALGWWLGWRRSQGEGAGAVPPSTEAI